MEWYGYLIVAVALCLVVLFTVVLIRTLRFVPQKETNQQFEKIEVDEAHVTDTLRRLVMCKTVSSYVKEEEDEKEFEKLVALLPKLFPNVYRVAEVIRPSDRSLILRWKGKDSSKCRIMMAHYDVVPVEEELWSKPAFDGIVEDNVLWGRGTIDTKGTLNGALNGAEILIAQGFVPQNDVYFAFAGDEEINGHGAPDNVAWFLSHNIHAELVVDEGGAVVQDVFPGVHERCAVVGIAEKGYINLEFSIEGQGGHASSPPPHTAVGILSKACANVENHPFPIHFSDAALKMFDTLGRRSGFLYRMIFANLWLFKGVLDLISRKSGGELNALMRTTVAFTQMDGSKAPNVIPPKASMVANFRIMSGETIDSSVAYIRKLVPDEVKLTVTHGMNPSTISKTNTEEWKNISYAIQGTWDNCIVSPYLMLACSDSRHYGVVSDCVYRFSAMALTKEERGSIHGNDERIPTKKIAETVEFYTRLLKLC